MKPESKAPMFLVAALAVILVSIGAASVYADMTACPTESGSGEMIREVAPDIGDADLATLLAFNVCAAYGRVGEGQNLPAVLQAAGPDLGPYLYPNGPIYSYGITYPGCIQIFLSDDHATNLSVTDEIYRVIDLHGRDLGVNGTPVIFACTSSAERKNAEETFSPPWMKSGGA